MRESPWRSHGWAVTLSRLPLPRPAAYVRIAGYPAGRPAAGAEAFARPQLARDGHAVRSPEPRAPAERGRSRRRARNRTTSAHNGKIEKLDCLTCGGRPRKLAYTSEHSPVAQSVEHLTVNQGVAGSSPARGATSQKRSPSTLTVAFSFSQAAVETGRALFARVRGGALPGRGTF
jgi:hypothetical protein